MHWTKVGADIDGEDANDLSGWSVSLSDDGSVVAIGAVYNDGGGDDSGHVRVYQNVGGHWSKVGGDIDGEAAWDWSGYSVSLSADGSVVAIGAINNDGVNGSNSGHVRVYAGASVMVTNSDLETAVNLWMSDKDGALSEYGDISEWHVSFITDMSSLFDGKTTFNDDISRWGVSNVTDMSNMFKDAVAFNQDIRDWNVSNVTDMSNMFKGAVAFNQDISVWNVSQGTNMSNMFQGATAFINHQFSNFEQSWHLYQPQTLRLAHAIVLAKREQELAAAAACEGQTLKAACGDPYVSPLYGDAYKLPDRGGNYRYVSTFSPYNSRFTIDADVRMLRKDEQADMLRYILAHNKDRAAKLQGRVVLDGYFFHNYLLTNCGDKLRVDMEANTINNGPLRNMSTDAFTVRMGRRAAQLVAPYHKEKNKVLYSITITTHHEAYGEIEVTLFKYANPQIRNGISMRTSRKMTRENAKGLILGYQPSKNFSIHKLGSKKDIVAYGEEAQTVSAAKKVMETFDYESSDKQAQIHFLQEQ